MPLILSGSLSVERLTITIADLPPSLSGLKLIHLSDLHYDGIRLSEKLLTQTIEWTNEEEADLIFLTGDFVTDDPTPINDLVLRLKHLESKYGVYACLGNHDIYFPHSQTMVREALTRIGIKVLWNEVAYPLGETLPIVGLADFWSREFCPERVMNKLNPRTPRLVLSHNPDTAEILQKWRVDLQHSGHTHGGQFVIPGFGPGVTLLQKIRHRIPKILRPWVPYLGKCSTVAQHWEWALGFHQIGNNQLYVNRGLGTYPPGRFFCPPELTVITLN